MLSVEQMGGKWLTDAIDGVVNVATGGNGCVVLQQQYEFCENFGTERWWYSFGITMSVYVLLVTCDWQFEVCEDVTSFSEMI